MIIRVDYYIISNFFLVLVGLLLLVNPFLPFAFGFSILVSIVFVLNIKSFDYTILAFIFFMPFSILVRWGSPDSFIPAGFREMFVIVYFFQYFSKSKFGLSRNVKTFVLLIFVTILGIFYHFESWYKTFFIAREYLIFFLYYFVVEDYFSKKNILFFNVLLIFLFFGAVFLASFNILAYKELINFPFKSIVYEGSDTATRGIGDFMVERMASVLGVSSGGTAIYYTIFIFVGIYLIFKGTGSWLKFCLVFGISVLMLANFYLISFSMIVSVLCFCLVYFSLRLKWMFILVALAIVPFLFFVSSYFSLSTSAGEISLLSYAQYIFSDYILALFGDFDLKDALFGIGFDVKSSEIERSAMVKRDFGIFSSYVSGGIFYLGIVFSLYYYVMKNGFSIYGKLVHAEKLLLILTIGAIFSTLFFLHGSPITTRPIDYILFTFLAILSSQRKNIWYRNEIKYN